MGEVYAGRYELVDQLGEGGAGAVWRVWDRRQQRYVAAKLLRQRDAEALLRFVREQSLRVAHPHVLAPTGWAAEDDDVLLTMDLVSGGSVAELLEEYGPLPVAFAVDLLDQLLDAVGAVHRAGLVHRDVKPSNLMLEATGSARPFLRLGDFGVAAILGKARLTDVGFVVGTPGYLAPEIWLGADPDPRQDIFAVGVVAWQLLTGQGPPASGPLPMDPRPPAVPEPLWQWVRGLTHHQPEHRYPDAGQARAALRSVLTSVPPVGPHDNRVVVPDRVGPLPAGWAPAHPAGQPGPVPHRPPRQATWELPTRSAPPDPTRRLSEHPGRTVGAAVTRPPARTAPAAQPRNRSTVWTLVRLVAAAALIVLAVILFALALR